MYEYTCTVHIHVHEQLASYMLTLLMWTGHFSSTNTLQAQNIAWVDNIHYYMYMYMVGSVNSVNWEYFTGMFHQLNFRLVLFSALWPLDEMYSLHLIIQEHISLVSFLSLKGKNENCFATKNLYSMVHEAPTTLFYWEMATL